jgi:hypothetical protein
MVIPNCWSGVNRGWRGSTRAGSNTRPMGYDWRRRRLEEEGDSETGCIDSELMAKYKDLDIIMSTNENSCHNLLYEGKRISKSRGQTYS